MSGNTHSDVLLAGAFAAFTVDVLIYPLDTLKTRFQSPDYKKIYYNEAQTAINRPVLFRGLYQGIGSVILVTLPSSGAFFTTYEGLKKLFNRVNPTSSGSSPLVPQPIIDGVASSIAELASCLILTPAEVIKQNAQMIQQPSSSSSSSSSQKSKPSPTLQTLKTFKSPGQLFRGYTALAARNLPFTAMQFPLFEHMKKLIKERRKENGTFTGTLTETATITGICAGTAGSIAAVITTPVDVVKTRIMLAAAGGSEEDAKKLAEEAKKQGKNADQLAKEKGGSRKGGMQVAKEIYRDAGMKGLFRGAILRAVWTAAGSGLYLGVYESGRVWLGDRRKAKEDIL